MIVVVYLHLNLYLTIMPVVPLHYNSIIFGILTFWVMKFWKKGIYNLSQKEKILTFSNNNRSEHCEFDKKI